jgi:hypothetical protein
MQSDGCDEEHHFGVHLWSSGAWLLWLAGAHDSSAPHTIRVHRDRWRAFLLAFLIHEGVVALDIVFELWDISGDIFAFVAMKNSGNTDLFIAFAVCLVPSTVFSAGSGALKLLLVKRRTTLVKRRTTLLKRRATPRAFRRPSHAAGRLDFRLFCEVFMLRRSEQRHEEHKNANDAASYMAYSYILLALTKVWSRAVESGGLFVASMLHAGCAVLRPQHDLAPSHRSKQE